MNYGALKGTCTRCQKKKHPIEVMRSVDDPAKIKLGDVLGKLHEVLLGTSGDTSCMMGALVARHSSKDKNKDIKLVAVSRNANLPKLRGNEWKGWRVVSPAVPNAHAGWTSIYGTRFSMPVTTVLTVQHVSRPCAAIKMLLELSTMEGFSPTAYPYLFMAEGVHKATGDRLGDNLRSFHGTDVSDPYMAQSCAQCEERLPLLLCPGDGD